MSLFPDPRVAPYSGVILNTYLHWFCKPIWACSLAPPVAVPLSAKTVCSFIRFRSGCSGLPVDTGRWAEPRVPRSQRVCQLCHSGQVCDEKHVVFECSMLAGLRDKYRRLFGVNTQTMLQFMWQKDIAGVASFVSDCLDAIIVTE